MGAVMGFSVRIGDKSRTILRELAAGLLNSLQAPVPCCSRKMGGVTISSSTKLIESGISLEPQPLSPPKIEGPH